MPAPMYSPRPVPRPQMQTGPTLSQLMAALSRMDIPKGPPAPNPGRVGQAPRDAFVRRDTFSNDPSTKYGASLLQLLLATGGRGLF